MRVAFRTDSSLLMGSGHLMRCLTLANELRTRGAEVVFISREHQGHIIHKLDDAGYYVYRLPAPLKQSMGASDDYTVWLGVTEAQDADESLVILHDHVFNLLVIDHYSLGLHWEKMVRSAVKRILVIDDLANREHDCDLLLDQNYFGDNTALRYINKVSDRCKCMLGPRYALLQPEYSELHKILPPHSGQIRSVLIFFGGSDPRDQTSKVLAALSCPELDNIAVDVVIGANHPDPEGVASKVAERPGTILHQHLPTLAGLMIRADLMIGAGGATTWERMCLGLPSVVISVARNQQECTRNLMRDHFQISTSEDGLASLTDWKNMVCDLVRQPSLVSQLSENARSLVDGLGTKRMVRAIYGIKQFDLTIRLATHFDGRLLFDWVNEEGVRKQSFQQEIVKQSLHFQWVDRKLTDSDCLILIGEDESGLSIGQVRFEINRCKLEALVDISIDSSLRGMGFSTHLLRKAINYWDIIQPKIKLIAEIRLDNLRSQKLFEKCGFIQAISRRIGAKTYELIIADRDRD